MKRTLIFAALATVMISPAFAAGATCGTSDAAEFEPRADLEAQLKTEGVTVRQIKTENGCYEVYGVDKSAKKIPQAYNAETLEKVDNPEAGEN